MRSKLIKQAIGNATQQKAVEFKKAIHTELYGRAATVLNDVRDTVKQDRFNFAK